MKKIIKRQLAPNQSAFLLCQRVMQNTARTVRGAAFTLIELLVVIAIIGILSGIIIVAMSNSTDSATIAKSQVFANSLRNALLSNLVSEWKLDGNANDSWGSINGTWHGAGGGTNTSANYRPASECIYGQCLNFDGTDDYVNFGNPSSLMGLTALAVTLWIKTGSDITTDSYPFYAGYWHQNGATSYGDCVRINAGNLTMYLRNTAGTVVTSNNNAVQTNTWYMAAYSWDGTNASFYFNGAPSATKQSFTGTVSRTSWQITLGGYTGNYAKVNIDDVRLYNSSIPITEIRRQYLAGIKQLLAKGEITKQEYGQRLADLNSPSPNATAEQSQSYAEK